MGQRSPIMRILLFFLGIFSVRGEVSINPLLPCYITYTSSGIMASAMRLVCGAIECAVEQMREVLPCKAFLDQGKALRVLPGRHKRTPSLNRFHKLLLGYEPRFVVQISSEVFALQFLLYTPPLCSQL